MLAHIKIWLITAVIIWESEMHRQEHPNLEHRAELHLGMVGRRKPLIKPLDHSVQRPSVGERSRRTATQTVALSPQEFHALFVRQICLASTSSMRPELVLMTCAEACSITLFILSQTMRGGPRLTNYKNNLCCSSGASVACPSRKMSLTYAAALSKEKRFIDISEAPW